MCGIAGSLEDVPRDRESSTNDVARMVASLVHRGPDDSGLWGDPAAGVYLGNRRLAIIDTSSAGHQPMASPSGRYSLVLNGEIYNHPTLRLRLADEGRAPAWRGSSDTETLVAAIDAWGLQATLSQVAGMFGLALWDHAARTLTLARDRTGEKPLYFGRFDGVWLFGSELKALLAHPASRRVVDRGAFARYMALGYVPAPHAIYRGVRKLLPGCTVVLRAGDPDAAQLPYWSPIEAIARDPLAFASDDAAVDEGETLLRDAVERQMLSDRPLGALLSGGVDSTCLVALMRATGRAHIRTFSIGFEENTYNEALFASRVARHFNTEHTELYVNALDVVDTIQRLPDMYDEPFADMSQIPTYLVSKLAAGSVTVALSGDGGDELFGGYPRYAMGTRLWSAIRRVPPTWRPAVAGLLGRAGHGAVDQAFSYAFPHDDRSGRRGLRPAQKLSKLGRAFSSPDVESLYWHLLSPWCEPALLRDPADAFAFPPGNRAADGRSIAEAFMLRDLTGYLPDDILTKVDRASMAASLETRAPMLDPQVVEFALRLPMRYKFRDGSGKWLLRAILDRHIPRHLVDRPKMGFVMPMASWLRGPLKDWAYDLVSSADHTAAGLLDLKALRLLLDRHSAGAGDWNQPLFAALMCLSWIANARPTLEEAAPRRRVVAEAA